ncbi:hypothetical protein DFH09DRAFT_1275771 [Mycena vulgaris]|nr:hypothetical protein DFH09DRAFT_1275771 [Mycena vulgaris]
MPERKRATGPGVDMGESWTSVVIRWRWDTGGLGVGRAVASKVMVSVRRRRKDLAIYDLRRICTQYPSERRKDLDASSRPPAVPRNGVRPRSMSIAARTRLRLPAAGWKGAGESGGLAYSGRGIEPSQPHRVARGVSAAGAMGFAWRGREPRLHTQSREQTAGGSGEVGAGDGEPAAETSSSAPASSQAQGPSLRSRAIDEGQSVSDKSVYGSMPPAEPDYNGNGKAKYSHSRGAPHRCLRRGRDATAENGESMRDIGRTWPRHRGPRAGLADEGLGIGENCRGGHASRSSAVASRGAMLVAGEGGNGGGWEGNKEDKLEPRKEVASPRSRASMGCDRRCVGARGAEEDAGRSAFGQLREGGAVCGGGEGSRAEGDGEACAELSV